MATISLTAINAGDDANAKPVDGNFDTIADLLNGNLDDANILNGGISLSTKAASENWSSYTVTWTTNGTQPAIGNGTLTGYYLKIGKNVYFRIKLTGGTTTTWGTGEFIFSLPVNAASDFTDTAIGNFRLRISAGNNYIGIVYIKTSSTVSCMVQDSTTGKGTGVGNGAPTGWTSGSYIYLSGVYEAA